MPGPDQIMETTVVRDGMLDRMRRATPGGALFPMESAEHRYQLVETKLPVAVSEEPFRDKLMEKAMALRQRLLNGETVVLKVGDHIIGQFDPKVGRGAMLAEALRATANNTFTVVENAVKPYSTVGCFGVGVEDRWRSGETSRPRAVIQAVAAAIDARPISEREVEAAAAVLPGVDLELVRRALVEARTARAIGG